MKKILAAALLFSMFGCGPQDVREDPPPTVVTPRREAMALEVVLDKPSAPVDTELNVTATVSSPTALTSVGAIDVSFVVVSGGGTTYITGGRTNDLGQVKNYWTLGPRAGEQVMEVRAVDQASGQKLVTYVKGTATPGPIQEYNASPTNVQLNAGDAWDMREFVIWGWDKYFNRVEVPQTQILYRVDFDGSATIEPKPECTVNGALLHCPYVSSPTVYRAHFRASDQTDTTFTVQLVYR